MDVGVLLYHIERFPGIVILTTNLIDNIDKAFFRRLKFVLLFDIPPRALRAKLWRVIYHVVFVFKLYFIVFPELHFIFELYFIVDIAT